MRGTGRPSGGGGNGNRAAVAVVGSGGVGEDSPRGFVGDERRTLQEAGAG